MAPEGDRRSRWPTVGQKIASPNMQTALFDVKLGTNSCWAPLDGLFWNGKTLEIRRAIFQKSPSRGGAGDALRREPAWRDEG